MIKFIRHNYIKSLKIISISVIIASLSGCLAILPPAVQLASLALDGVSYAATGKSVTDHALSGLTDQDCAMIRVLKGQDVCIVEDIGVAVIAQTDTAHSDALDQSQIDAFDRNGNLSLVNIDDMSLDNIDDMSLDMETAQGPL